MAAADASPAGCNTSSFPTRIRSWPRSPPWPRRCATTEGPSPPTIHSLPLQETVSKPDRRRRSTAGAISPRRCRTDFPDRSTARRRCRPRPVSIPPTRGRCESRPETRFMMSCCRNGSPSSSRKFRPADCAKPLFAPSSTPAWVGVPLTHVDSRPCVAFALDMEICRCRNSRRSCASSSRCC